MADGAGFSPEMSGEKVRAAHQRRSIGPGSNTGQKGEPGALIDYVTIVLPESVLEEHGIRQLEHLLSQLFGFRGEVVASAVREQRWQFYTRSAVLVDREGEMVGRIGMGGNGGTVCVSLSGAGCRWVKSWARVHASVVRWRGKLSRVDVAFDDYEGDKLCVHDLRERASNGEFQMGGRPPQHRFLSDEGHGTGSTLYVGSKGHKEFCAYEKGKQLGLKNSPWVRAEVRLYGKHADLPLDVLLRPLEYLRGSYSVLQLLITGVCERIKTVRKSVEASGTAMVEWLRRQVGPSIFLLREAFGASWADFAEDRVAREGSPRRFAGIRQGDQFYQLLREELCPS